jgi:hypothetical protein
MSDSENDYDTEYRIKAIYKDGIKVKYKKIEKFFYILKISFS